MGDPITVVDDVEDKDSFEFTADSSELVAWFPGRELHYQQKAGLPRYVYAW